MDDADRYYTDAEIEAIRAQAKAANARMRKLLDDEEIKATIRRNHAEMKRRQR